MPDLVGELNSLDFSNYIGGPLQAAIDAQHSASISTVNFIREVGFEEPGTANEKIRYVTFKVRKTVPVLDQDDKPVLDVNGDPTTTEKEVDVEVPFLTMLTVPALRIDEMVIDFNAKLTSTETSSAESQFEAKAELGVNYKVVKFKASAAYKRKSSKGLSVEKTYNLGVRVTAVNDELPAGLDRILTMLEDNIRSE